MDITQINIKDLTNEEFVNSYKECLIRFRLQGSGFSFDELLKICLNEGWITMQRAIELKKLYKI